MRETRGKRYRRVMRWSACGALLVGVLSGSLAGQAAELYRWVDEQGGLALSDTPPRSLRDRAGLKVSRQGSPSAPAEPGDSPAGDARQTPPASTAASGIVVEAVLNRRLTAPLRLDPGAELTVLTKQVATTLHMAEMEHLPRHPVATAGGMVTMPVTSLRSLRIGSAEARDVAVAIDLEGRLPMGLLGLSFLRRFQVTVDQERGQVTFAR